MTTAELFEAIFNTNVPFDISHLAVCKVCKGPELDDDLLIGGAHWNCFESVVVSVPREIYEQLVAFNKY